MGRGIETLPQNTDHGGRKGGNHKAVETIHHPAMPRNEPACVLGRKAPFDGGLRTGRRLGTAPITAVPEWRWLRGCRIPLPYATAMPAAMAPIRPPSAPDQVFFGLTRAHNSGPPTARPVKYARMSVAQTTAKRNTRAVKPQFGVAPEQNRAEKRGSRIGQSACHPQSPVIHQACGYRARQVRRAGRVA